MYILTIIRNGKEQQHLTRALETSIKFLTARGVIIVRIEAR